MPKSLHWLNESLGQYDLKEGVFKLQSTLAWAAALRFEIEASHGSDPTAQLEACRRHFRCHEVRTGPDEKLGRTYCALFHALTSAETLVSLDCAGFGRPWMYPTAVVTWYYTHYHVFRSIALARNQPLGDTHTSLQRSINGPMRRLLPHPYNMHSAFGTSGQCTATLPDSPGAVQQQLTTTFDETGVMAQGMLLAYLTRTAKREADDVEQDILKKNAELRDFRSRAAKDLRNERLRKLEINFMHCAYRYRGKANYRDPLYLAYGTQKRQDHERYLHNLAVSARFAFICGLAFAERAYGATRTTDFFADMQRNFRGAALGNDTELFWRSLFDEAQPALV